MTCIRVLGAFTIIVSSAAITKFGD